MPKRKAPKRVNREIIKAIQYLTNHDPYVTVKLAEIVSRVKFRLKGVPFDQKMDKMIKDAICKLRDLGLIDHVGHNQYCCPDCFANEEVHDSVQPFPQPEAQPGKPNSSYFIPYTRKTTTENGCSLDPNRKKRQHENESTSSLSGNEFERTRKRFYGQKVIKKNERNPPLPGARQVPEKRKETDYEENGETPTCSWGNLTCYNTIIPRRCCNIVQLSKSDDELMRSIERFETEEENIGNLKLNSDAVESINDGETSFKNAGHKLESSSGNRSDEES